MVAWTVVWRARTAALVERSMALEAEVPQSVVDRFTVELPHMVKQE